MQVIQQSPAAPQKSFSYFCCCSSYLIFSSLFWSISLFVSISGEIKKADLSAPPRHSPIIRSFVRYKQHCHRIQANRRKRKKRQAKVQSVRDSKEENMTSYLISLCYPTWILTGLPRFYWSEWEEYQWNCSPICRPLNYKAASLCFGSLHSIYLH